MSSPRKRRSREQGITRPTPRTERMEQRLSEFARMMRAGEIEYLENHGPDLRRDVEERPEWQAQFNAIIDMSIKVAIIDRDSMFLNYLNVVLDVDVTERLKQQLELAAWHANPDYIEDVLRMMEDKDLQWDRSRTTELIMAASSLAMHQNEQLISNHNGDDAAAARVQDLAAKFVLMAGQRLISENDTEPVVDYVLNALKTAYHNHDYDDGDLAGMVMAIDKLDPEDPLFPELTQKVIDDFIFSNEHALDGRTVQDRLDFLQDYLQDSQALSEGLFARVFDLESAEARLADAKATLDTCMMEIQAEGDAFSKALFKERNDRISQANRVYLDHLACGDRVNALAVAIRDAEANTDSSKLMHFCKLYQRNDRDVMRDLPQHDSDLFGANKTLDEMIENDAIYKEVERERIRIMTDYLRPKLERERQLYSDLGDEVTRLKEEREADLARKQEQHAAGMNAKFSAALLPYEDAKVVYDLAQKAQLDIERRLEEAEQQLAQAADAPLHKKTRSIHSSGVMPPDLPFHEGFRASAAAAAGQSRGDKHKKKSSGSRKEEAAVAAAQPSRRKKKSSTTVERPLTVRPKQKKEGPGHPQPGRQIDIGKARSRLGSNSFFAGSHSSGAGSRQRMAERREEALAAWKEEGKSKEKDAVAGGPVWQELKDISKTDLSAYIRNHEALQPYKNVLKEIHQEVYRPPLPATPPRSPR